MSLSLYIKQVIVALVMCCVLGPFKAGKIHGIRTDRIIFTEPLGCRACLYSQVGKPHTPQASYLPACLCVAHAMALAPSMAPIVTPVPLRVPHHHHQQGVPTCLSTRGEQSQKTARTLHNIT